MAEQRQRARIQLNLPVRLRWQGALRSFIEVTETLDASRNGLLLSLTQPCPVNATVWATFPYDPESPSEQPETPARVVRVKTPPTGGYLVAVEFKVPQRRLTPEAGFNRRTKERIPIAFPIRVRPSATPWPEETMTIDISDGGVRFQTARQYAVGETLRVAVPYGPWASTGEVLARVVRIEPVAGSVEQHIALARIAPSKP